jgi:phage tail sheath gpL-like
MSSPNIAFDTIPAGLRKPGQYFEFNTRMAQSSLPGASAKVMLIGQKMQTPAAWPTSTAVTVGKIAKPVTGNGHIYICTTAGTTHSAEPTWPTTQGGSVTETGGVIWRECGVFTSFTAQSTPTQVFSDDEVATQCGSGSILHLMAMAALRVCKSMQLFFCSLDDANGTTPTGTVTITGTATKAGFVRVWFGDQYVEATYATSATPTVIALAIHNAIGANYKLPVSSSVAAGVVTIIGKHRGTILHAVKTECDSASTPDAGVSVAVVQLASGATDPTWQTALDTIASERYNIIVPCYSDSTNLLNLKTHLTTVSNYREKKAGIGVVGFIQSNISTAAALGVTLNFWRLALCHLKADRSPEFCIGAAAAAGKALLPDPSVPVKDVDLPGIALPAIASRTIASEQETLLANGITPLEVSPETGYVSITRMVSTAYSESAILDIHKVCTLDYFRDAVVSRVKQRFPRDKMTARKLGDLKSEIFAVAKAMEALEMLENVDAWKDYLIVEIDSQTEGQANARIPADVPAGLFIVAGRFDLL